MTDYTADHHDAAECRRLRESHGLSLAAMAELARLSSRQTWAAYEAGTRMIDSARWELCLLLLAAHPTLQLAATQSANASA